MSGDISISVPGVKPGEQTHAQAAAAAAVHAVNNAAQSGGGAVLAAAGANTGAGSASVSHSSLGKKGFKEEVLVLEEKASGELWWIFQHVDSGVEAIIDSIDRKLGGGHGHKVRAISSLPLRAFIFKSQVTFPPQLLSCRLSHILCISG